MEDDMEKYVWEGSKSHEIIQKLLGEEELKTKVEIVDKYKNTVCTIQNQGRPFFYIPFSLAIIHILVF